MKQTIIILILFQRQLTQKKTASIILIILNLHIQKNIYQILIIIIIRGILKALKTLLNQNFQILLLLSLYKYL